ncbi:archaeal enzyme of ATP-grasp superfamily [Cenarchaeum symbiosum A]|uniref:Archaeal enzyme of ATP-grasp superfamily n=1 Tax=Cenarchaeum symbiosum (strain A) TaxID=414004 RepID=A0RUK2_CENSY|nr:archaeal enzyme of ATP-grasp superfamily [Cenarchaeum symbiosum A]
MGEKFKITETRPIDVKGGYLIEGFPSIGLTSAIATESLIRTTNFELAGFIDSDRFPPVSLVRNGEPTFPTTIHVNNALNVAVFSSYLMLNEKLHKEMARTLLGWAKKHGISNVISSVATKSPEAKTAAAASTVEARKMLKEKGIPVIEHGAIPGIPGALLNHGVLSGQNVIVLTFSPSTQGPDFNSSIELCNAFASIVPGVSCDIPALKKESERAELEINAAKLETKNLSDGMYG